MKSSPRAKHLLALLNPALCIAGSILVLYLGRVATLYVLARGFQQLNLNSETYAHAPSWLQFIAGNADRLASFVGLILASCAVILLKNRASTDGRSPWSSLVNLPVGFALGIGLLALLRWLDEIRCLPDGFAADWFGCVLWLCRSVFTALCLRGAFDPDTNRWAAYSISMLLQALIAWYLLGKFDALLTLNALLFGFLSVWLYRRKKSVWPEILLFYGYALSHRVLFAYPSGKLFYMSANPLSGGDAGLFGSILTAAFLVLAIVLGFLKNITIKKRSLKT